MDIIRLIYDLIYMEDGKQLANELHSRRVKRFPRRSVIVLYPDQIWAIDLAFMDSLKEYNDDYKYILCVVDAFSKYAWATPLKNKNSSTVLSAIKKIVEDNGKVPNKIWVDKGTEFYNQEFKKWVDSNKIVMYSTYGESKSMIAESFIKTLKTNLQKYFTETNSRNWIDVLPKIVKEYNNHKHSSIKMTPNEARKEENEVQAYKNLRNSHKDLPTKQPKFKVGDEVRISRLKDTFTKGYEHNFSYEVFKISQVLDTLPITYKIVDYHDEPIEGSFYEQELVKTKVPNYYEVEKILKSRKKGKEKESLVKFYGWPSKFNEWIPDKDISDI